MKNTKILNSRNKGPFVYVFENCFCVMKNKEKKKNIFGSCFLKLFLITIWKFFKKMFFLYELNVFRVLYVF